MGVGRLAYVAVLAFCLIGTAWLEIFLHVRVYHQWRRLVLSLAPVLLVFVSWDVYAIAHGHWTFDTELTTGVLLPGQLPLEEVLFFVVVPTCALLSFEAVRGVLARRRSPRDRAKP